MSWSTIEYKPTDTVAQLLIIKHEITDFARKLCALPFALKATSFFSLTVKYTCAHGLDRVGGGAELVRGDVRNSRGLPGCMRCMACRSVQIPGRRVCRTSRRAGLRHSNFTSGPSARQFDSSTRPVIIGLQLLEQMQHMLGAIGCPHRKPVMIGVLEITTATHSDEPGVPLLW
jgi:hypothetical protein